MQMKRLCSVVLIVTFFIGAIGIAVASEKGNARKGKYLFRKNCRTCHMNEGTAQELSPNSKTQAEWNKVFESYDQLECKAAWENLSEKDRYDMYTQLWGHAFDSPTPAKCK